jgi:uncharacterized protein YqjF (DUF2071 family)
MMMLAILFAAAAADSPIERRCGWLHNPTPANWWLVDRDGQWTLSTQGGPSAPGWEDLGGARSSQWVETNGSYGYGCACASMRIDRRSGDVLEIRSISPRPLKACRADRRLPKP